MTSSSLRFIKSNNLGFFSDQLVISNLLMPMPNNSMFSIITFDLTFWINLIILSVFAMAFGTSIYFYASTTLGPKKASSYIFLVPFTAILFSMYFLNEPFQLSTILGVLGLEVCSLYVITNK